MTDHIHYPDPDFVTPEDIWVCDVCRAIFRITEPFNGTGQPGKAEVTVEEIDTFGVAGSGYTYERYPLRGTRHKLQT